MNSRLYLALLAVIAVSGCSTVEPVGSPGNQLAPVPPADDFNWPAGYRPADATFHVHNEIDIDAPPDVVWQVLIDAGSWSDWYDGASDMSMSGPLEPDSEFRWKTMGFRFTSVIHEFEPPHRLAWESRRGALKGYHAWLIVPTEAGSRVMTAETQYGLLANLQIVFQPNKLHRLHDVWLAEMKERAEAKAGI